MSRLLYQAELHRRATVRPGLATGPVGHVVRAPLRNRTVDLLLSMETLCRLSLRGVLEEPSKMLPDVRWMPSEGSGRVDGPAVRCARTGAGGWRPARPTVRRCARAASSPAGRRATAG